MGNIGSHKKCFGDLEDGELFYDRRGQLCQKYDKNNRRLLRMENGQYAKCTFILYTGESARLVC